MAKSAIAFVGFIPLSYETVNLNGIYRPVRFSDLAGWNQGNAHETSWFQNCNWKFPRSIVSFKEKHNTMQFIESECDLCKHDHCCSFNSYLHLVFDFFWSSSTALFYCHRCNVSDRTVYLIWDFPHWLAKWQAHVPCAACVCYSICLSGFLTIPTSLKAIMNPGAFFRICIELHCSCIAFLNIEKFHESFPFLFGFGICCRHASQDFPTETVLRNSDGKKESLGMLSWQL